MRIVFFGTPQFAVPSLEAVSREHDVVLVVAQPDRRAGRGLKLQRPAVVEKAEELGLPFHQPLKVRDEAFLQSIADLRPDAGVVVAYGRILPTGLLEIPRLGFLNVHASILPKYRGAAPMQRAVEAGEPMTGVTIMRVEEELDSGPVYAIDKVPIGPDERLPSLSARLAEVGADALLRVLANPGTPTPQDHSRATHAPKVEKQEGRITFDEPVAAIYNKFRAFDPWPGVFFESGGETIKIVEMRSGAGAGPGPGPGPGRDILAIDDGVTVATRDGAVRLLELQRSGKPRASAGDIARGLGWRAGAPIP